MKLRFHDNFRRYNRHQKKKMAVLSQPFDVTRLAYIRLQDYCKKVTLLRYNKKDVIPIDQEKRQVAKNHVLKTHVLSPSVYISFQSIKENNNLW